MENIIMLRIVVLLRENHIFFTNSPNYRIASLVLVCNSQSHTICGKDVTERRLQRQFAHYFHTVFTMCKTLF